jgi:hypothetical protein
MIGPDGRPRVRLIVSLRTTDLATAIRGMRRWRRLRRRWNGPARKLAAADRAIAGALEWRDTIANLGTAHASADAEADSDLAQSHGGKRSPGLPRARPRPASLTTSHPNPVKPLPRPRCRLRSWLVDEEAQTIADKHGDAAAERFTRAARSLATPLKPLIAAWLREEDIEARSRGDHQRAADELLALERAKTVSKRLWSLSSLWRHLIRKGLCETNPWLGHDIGWQGRSGRDKMPERPFHTGRGSRPVGRRRRACYGGSDAPRTIQRRAA